MDRHRAPSISGSWSPGAAQAIDSASLLRVDCNANTEKKVNGWTHCAWTQRQGPRDTSGQSCRTDIERICTCFFYISLFQHLFLNIRIQRRFFLKNLPLLFILTILSNKLMTLSLYVLNCLLFFPTPFNPVLYGQ
jgi:hypothetical protein